MWDLITTYYTHPAPKSGHFYVSMLLQVHHGVNTKNPNLERVEALAEDLLDFKQVGVLERWLLG